MLHIQKQNRFFEITPEAGVGTEGKSKPKKNLLTPVEIQEAGESFTKEKEAIVWYTKKGLIEMVDDIQQALVQAQYLKPEQVDGQIGVTTVKALMKFQAANGLKGDGKAGAKTMIKLGIFPEAPTNIVNNSQEPQVIMAEAEAPVINEKVKSKSLLAGILGFAKAPFILMSEGLKPEGALDFEKFNKLQKIDDSIDAATPGFDQLEIAIDTIKDIKNPDQKEVAIEQAYSLGDTILSTSEVSDKILSIYRSAKNPLEKGYVLLFVQNARMGGKGSPERINENNISAIISADKKNAGAQDREWSKYGVNMSKMRTRAHSLLQAQGTYNQENYKDTTKTVLWSLRSKNMNQKGGKILGGLQPYAAGSIETVNLQGAMDQLPISITKQTLQTLVDNLSPEQYASIRQNVLKSRKISDQQIQEMIVSGKLKSTASYAKSANCFNDAIALTFSVPKVSVVQETGGDKYIPETPVDDDQTSTPGVDTGGDNGGGNPDVDTGNDDSF